MNVVQLNVGQQRADFPHQAFCERNHRRQHHMCSGKIRRRSLTLPPGLHRRKNYLEGEVYRQGLPSEKYGGGRKWGEVSSIFSSLRDVPMMRNRVGSVICCLLLVWSVLGDSIWSQRYPDPTAGQITSISYGQNKFLATSLDGTLLSSTDDGNSWTPCSSPAEG